MVNVFQTDWLASRPVFYNESTGKVSHNINDVIDIDDLEFHSEGFHKYLEVGYSVLGQSPVRNVKFLRHSTRLIAHDDGRLEFEYLEDPVDKWLGKQSHEDDVLHLLHSAIHNWENSVEGEIIIPTSGGYDSRFLNLMIEDRARIRSFSYGLSKNQANSFEVIHAQKVSEILGTSFEQIPLGDFHLYFDEWDALFGVSTHAHGMYQIEFYRKVLTRVAGGNPVLSGIIGDAWAGSVNIPDLTSPADVVRLGYSHGLAVDPSISLLRENQSTLFENYYASHRDKLASPLFRVVEAMRFKIFLLSYLLIVPSSLGLRPWSPFLDPEIALSMLSLPAERRAKRIWQKDFFRKHGLDLESMAMPSDTRNELNYYAIRKVPLEPLDVGLLREVVKPDYVNWVNRHINRQRVLPLWVWKVHQTPKVAGLLSRLGISDQRLESYVAYLILKPIEKLLRRRDARRTEPDRSGGV